MKSRWFKKFGILCLSIMMTAGCGKENRTELEAQQGPGMENQLTEEEVAAYEEADKIEVEELNSITDWKEKTEISLGKNITVDGNGAEVSEENTLLITEGGSYVISGELSDGMIQIETQEDVKLVLNGVSITKKDGPALYVKEASSCYIETVKGTENTFTDGESYTETEEKLKGTIFSNDRLVFFGEGMLKLNGNYKHAICSDDEVYIESGTYEITSVKDGIHTNNWICVDGGNLNIVSADDGLQSEGPVVVHGGELTIAADGKGVTAYGDLTVNDGNITISKCEEGLESKNDLVVNDGIIEIIGSDDGLNARTSITVNGGILYAEVLAGDALDSNGSMTITGGLVLAFGAQQPEGGIDCDANEIQITGGTLIATGGTNSSPSETESSQVSVLLGRASKGDTIGIQDSGGNTVFAFEVPKEYSNMLLSVGTITSNQDYTVYIGGTITGEGYHGYYVNGIYEGGTESVSFSSDGMVVSAGGTSDSMGGPGGKMPQGGERPEMPKPNEQGENKEVPEA